MKILITSGGTAEPVDGVRFLTNFSTGHTGAVLARNLQQMGHQVTLLRAARAEAAPEAEERLFTDFYSLDQTLKKILACEDFDLVVQAAAVGDFAVESVQINGQNFAPDQLPKIPSGLSVRLLLKPTHKIIDRIACYARRRPVVVGFKLTNGLSQPAAQEAASRVQADWVVQNDLTDIRAGKRIFTLYRNGQKIQQIKGLDSLAQWLGTLGESRL